MPMYEYVCGACGHHIEVLQRISDLPLIHCAHCKQDALKRMVSRSGFRLKGEGWYETDFKGGDNKRNLVDASDNASPPASDKSASSSTENKPKKETPAAKPETKAD